jgi:hypothetical protein
MIKISRDRYACDAWQMLLAAKARCHKHRAFFLPYRQQFPESGEKHHTNDGLVAETV